jgi:hypothetical protein
VTRGHHVRAPIRRSRGRKRRTRHTGVIGSRAVFA